MKKLILMSFAAGLLSLACLWLYLSFCGKGVVGRCNYNRIENGMTLEEVTALLGPGDEVSGVPIYVDHSEPDREKRFKPVVTGERCFQWPKGWSMYSISDLGAVRIIIGLKDGKVCDKWIYEPSL
jgi:hypothetical protein